MTLTLPTYTTIPLDDHFLVGKHQGAQPLDPDDAMSLGIPFGTTLALLPDSDAIALIARLSEGTGTTVGNESQGDDGTLDAGTWQTDPTGRVQLSNPQIEFPHHASMNHTVDSGSGTILSVSAGFLLRNWSAGTLLDKAGVTTINRDDFPDTLPADEWFTAGITLAGDDVGLYVNGQRVGTKTLGSTLSSDPGNPLYIGQLANGTETITAEMEDITYSGLGLALSLIQSANPSNGLWTSDVIDLGAEKTLSKITHTDSFVSPTHRVFLELRLGDDAELSTFRREAWDLARGYIDQPAKGFYPTTLLSGRYLQAQLSLSQAAQTPFRPLIRNLDLRFR